MTVSVEFVGLPGVGKSTLSRRAAATLVSDHSRVMEPIRRIDNRSGPHRVLSKGRFITEHALRRPQNALSMARTLFSTDQASTSDRVRVGFNLQYVAGVMARARSTPGVTLFDQGPYQGVWSVGLRSSTDWGLLFDRFDWFLSCAAPDLVVCVDADTDTIADRLANRSGGDTRLSTGSPQFNRAVAGYEQLKTHLTATDCRTITVTNETKEMVEPNAARVVDEIRSLTTQSH